MPSLDELPREERHKFEDSVTDSMTLDDLRGVLQDDYDYACWDHLISLVVEKRWEEKQDA